MTRISRNLRAVVNIRYVDADDPAQMQGLPRPGGR